MIPTTDEDAMYGRAPWDEAKALQRPLPDVVLKIVLRCRQGGPCGGIENSGKGPEARLGEIARNYLGNCELNCGEHARGVLPCTFIHIGTKAALDTST